MLKEEGTPTVQKYRMCPISVENLGVLGKKWTVHILQNIFEGRADRFNDILRSLPGLTPRLLIIRLRELERCQLIAPLVIQRTPRIVRWVITEKGKETAPILQGYITYATRWHAKHDSSLESDATPSALIHIQDP